MNCKFLPSVLYRSNENSKWAFDTAWSSLLSLLASFWQITVNKKTETIEENGAALLEIIFIFFNFFVKSMWCVVVFTANSLLWLKNSDGRKVAGLRSVATKLSAARQCTMVRGGIIKGNYFFQKILQCGASKVFSIGKVIFFSDSSLNWPFLIHSWDLMDFVTIFLVVFLAYHLGLGQFLGLFWTISMVIFMDVRSSILGTKSLPLFLY